MLRTPSNAELRRAARQIWEAGLAASRPETAVGEAVEVLADGIRLGRERERISGRLVVVGAGKAAPAMALQVERLLGRRIWKGIAVAPYGHGVRTQRIELLEAAHPVPDAAGEAAAARIEALIGDLTEDDLVLCLFSGGASALMSAPAPGVSLAAKQAVTESLLRSGASIGELNTVRKHLSRLKGGRLAERAHPARLVSLVMSDVVGDPLDAIASGPTTGDPSTYRDAAEVLDRYRVPAPPEVSSLLARGVAGTIPETPKPDDPLFARVRHELIANNLRLVAAAAARARELGFRTRVLGTDVEGEAREAGQRFASIAREMSAEGSSLELPVCVAAGGETTVRVRGDGRGGRNLEMALAWALGMRGWRGHACFASVASDGRDGPTDAAGGLVDPATCSRIVAAGLDAEACLERNDSSPGSPGSSAAGSAPTGACRPARSSAT
jgi:hydroxypyruvate reductase